MCGCGTWGHVLVVGLALLGEQFGCVVSRGFSNLNGSVILFSISGISMWWCPCVCHVHIQMRCTPRHVSFSITDSGYVWLTVSRMMLGSSGLASSPAGWEDHCRSFPTEIFLFPPLSFPSFPFPSRMWITAPWSQHSVPAVNHRLCIGKMETGVEAINSVTIFSVSGDHPQAQFTSTLWLLMDFCGELLYSSCDWFLKSWTTKVSILFRKFQPCQYCSSSGSEQIDQISS